MEHNDTQNICLLFSPGVENNHWIKLRKFFIKKASSFKKHILSVVISRKIPLSSTHSKLVLKQRDQLFLSLVINEEEMIFLLIHKAFYIIKTCSTTTYGVSGQFGNGQLTEKWHRCVPVWVCESAADLWIYRKNFDWHALELQCFAYQKNCDVLC